MKFKVHFTMDQEDYQIDITADNPDKAVKAVRKQYDKPIIVRKCKLDRAA